VYFFNSRISIIDEQEHPNTFGKKPHVDAIDSFKQVNSLTSEKD
jgi:hypothetical protein